ncbi:COG1361 family protein [Halococcoides cellulosivorans]|uniref:CARDB domain-containing protein n=1 Tax=Halococcoides cellulosivorans TaxID=1679096 RepID=A0A2R4WYZ3_9EURY|nr:hypothetical protein [Halococcoides cellulosivorans]AWB26767.1 hypothetical protein HARCEL1_03075 [Halococcoides cellulosivorans]
MRRGLAALVAVAVIGSLLAVPTGAATADPIDITDVSPAPEAPIAGETVTLTVDVAVPANASGSLDLTDVYVRGAEGTDLDRVRDPGSVAPGETVPVTLTVTPDDPGSMRLRMKAVGKLDGEIHSTTSTTVLDVRETGDVLLSMPDPDPVAGSTTTVEVGVANGADTAISTVELGLSGDADIDSPRRVTASIPARTDETFTFEASFPDPGSYELTADLSYRVDGVYRTTTRTITVEAGNQSDATGLAGAIELTELRTSSGNLVTIEGNAANVGGESVRSVLLSIEDTEQVTPREGSGEYFVGTINASTFETFELVGSVEGEPPSEVPVVAEYITDGQRRETTFTVDVSGGGGPPVDGGERGVPNRGAGVDGSDRVSGPDRVERPQRGGLPLGAILSIAVPLIGLLAVGGGGYLVWSRR